ncbi:hypothetical protein N0V83_006743 [Neocucurbitaria cava]|uniref:Uncharacterized protein n=1 Tax=Neocucurbitaria cava TaxID=798079 RepID=A0A9W9CL98_9PLEO|nr:hypothetical protein N0V83_006743 [Neocucurbitaria cava]
MAVQPPLFRLPRELRDQILAYVFDDLEEPRVQFKHHVARAQQMTPPYKDLPALSRASKQLYYEATLLFLTHITPVLSDIETICWMREWLSAFSSDSAFRSIRQLAFRNFHGPDQIRGYELIAMCPNIRFLDIMFGDEYAHPGTVPTLAIKSLSSSVNAYESLDNIIAMHQLYRLVDIPKLKGLHFGFHDWDSKVSNDRARQVMAWLRAKFQAQKRHVQIECKQMWYNFDDEDEHDACCTWFD